MPVHLSIEGPIATLTLDEPGRRNAMTPELGDALKARVEELKGRSDVRVVLLTGAGGAFSGGGDLTMLERLRSVPAEEARQFMLGFYARYLSVLDLEVPTIAVVEGAAIGAGFCLALACDFCFVDLEAKLALNFVQLGLHPGMGATYFVPRRAGAAEAARLLRTGQRFDGADAVGLGLALDGHPLAEVMPAARAFATTLAAQAPLAIKALKAELGADRAVLQRCLEAEAAHQAVSYGSADMAEGLAAAAARRAPVFTGR